MKELKAIFVKAGHGLNQSGISYDPGAVANGIEERDVTREVAKSLANHLSKYRDIKVYSIGADENLSLTQKIRQVNDICKKEKYTVENSILLSIHVNAGGGTGPEVYIWDSYQPALDLGKAIVDNLSQKTGLRNRGVKGQSQSARGSLATIRDTIPLAILIELAFLDSPVEKEIKMLKESRFLFSDTIESTIVKYFNLKNSETCDFSNILKILEVAVKSLINMKGCDKEMKLRRPLLQIFHRLINFIKLKQK